MEIFFLRWDLIVENCAKHTFLPVLPNHFHSIIIQSKSSHKRNKACRIKTPRLSCMTHFVLFLFFQAEDGIRDATVTGVQTCALPIYGIRDAIVTGVQTCALPISRHTRCYRDWSSDVCSSD